MQLLCEDVSKFNNTKNLTIIKICMEISFACSYIAIPKYYMLISEIKPKFLGTDFHNNKPTNSYIE